MRKLEVGSGKRPTEGYVHMDVLPTMDMDVFHDAVETHYRFKDGEFSEIYSHWVLEHFAYRDIYRILKDWYRILENKGRIYAVTSNQEALNKSFADKTITWQEWIRITFGLKEPGEEGGSDVVTLPEVHKIAWNEEFTRKIFTDCGFTSIEVYPTWECREPDGKIKCPGLTIIAFKYE